MNQRTICSFNLKDLAIFRGERMHFNAISCKSAIKNEINVNDKIFALAELLHSFPTKDCKIFQIKRTNRSLVERLQILLISKISQSFNQRTFLLWLKDFAIYKINRNCNLSWKIQFRESSSLLDFRNWNDHTKDTAGFLIYISYILQITEASGTNRMKLRRSRDPWAKKGNSWN